LVTRLDPEPADVTEPNTADDVALGYSTYLGGLATDIGDDLAVDSAGAAYVTGSSDSTSFPIEDPFHGDQAGTDAFVTKINPDGGAAMQTLAYSTYLGGGDTDDGNGIAVDTTGAAYVTGFTQSIGASAFPTQDPFQTNQGSADVFVTKLTQVPAPPAPAAIPAPTGPVTLTPSLCVGLTPNRTGTAGNDRIVGTSGPDVIVGLDGDDVVTAGAGNDVVCGGSGRDRLNGGAGRDRLIGGEGIDLCRGNKGKDRVACERKRSP
jgi:Ca2+-binding RTX toxin-like protein